MSKYDVDSMFAARSKEKQPCQSKCGRHWSLKLCWGFWWIKVRTGYLGTFEDQMFFASPLSGHGLMPDELSYVAALAAACWAFNWTRWEQLHGLVFLECSVRNLSSGNTLWNPVVLHACCRGSAATTWWSPAPLKTDVAFVTVTAPPVRRWGERLRRVKDSVCFWLLFPLLWHVMPTNSMYYKVHVCHTSWHKHSERTIWSF